MLGGAMFEMSMTTQKKGCLVGCLALDVVIIWLVILMCQPSDPTKTVEGLLGTNLPIGTQVLATEDTGPGLPLPGGASDGHTWIVLQISEDQKSNFTHAVSSSLRWKRLPLPPDLTAQAQLLQPMDKVKGHIPLKTAKGYFILIDRNYLRRLTTRSPEQLYEPNRSLSADGCNFTFGLFDETTGKVYVWDIDT
jgi:hypothetical protein